MRKELFKKIEKQFGRFSSFAVWGKDIGDLSVIQKNIRMLHGRVIFVGYNISGSVQKLQNFHKPHRGGKDTWWAASIGRNRFLRGAYMTDFFKSDTASREKSVRRSASIRKKNRVFLAKEIRLLTNSQPTIVAIGRNTEKELVDAGYHCFYVPNPAARITKKFFTHAISVLASTIKKQ